MALLGLQYVGLGLVAAALAGLLLLIDRPEQP